MRAKLLGTRGLLTAGALCTGLLAACSDAGPLRPQVSARAGTVPAEESATEYEWDTGELACPAVLNSNVRYWVNINAVGPRAFTFYAPHFRTTYVGGGVYRYRMTLGRSDDNEWLAEGSWTGRCIGFGQWGIGKVLSFEGTVWRVNGGGGAIACRTTDTGSSGESGGGVLDEAGTYDPYDPYDPDDGEECTGGGGPDGGSGIQYEPGDRTGGETVDWGTGIGNGGASACGTKAVVEYICIDYWVEGVGWVEWGCGFVTTC